MQFFRKNLFALILPVMILSYSDFIKTSPLLVQGTVVDVETGKPVNKAYLYIIQGSEEILSGNDGSFKISSWQKLPLTVTVEHADYEREVIKVTDASAPLKIRLRKK
jgi:hypothetical protein